MGYPRIFHSNPACITLNMDINKHSYNSKKRFVLEFFGLIAFLCAKWQYASIFLAGKSVGNGSAIDYDVISFLEV